MKNLLSKINIIIIIFITVIPIISPLCFVYAQQDISSIEIVNSYTINDADAKDGDIIINSTDGFKRASAPQDERIFGVLNTQPLMLFKDKQQNAKKPISRNGIALVNVTTINGEIKQGDSITSSEVPGAGEKATQSGYILGTALANFTNNDGAQTEVKSAKSGKNVTVRTGQIQVALRIEYAEINSSRSALHLLDSLNSAIYRSTQDPNKTLDFMRYLIAGVVALLGFIISFLAFIRSVPKSIEAIGRNPLAKSAIYLSIGMNIALAVVTAIIATIAAFIIIKI